MRIGELEARSSRRAYRDRSPIPIGYSDLRPTSRCQGRKSEQKLDRLDDSVKRASTRLSYGFRGRRASRS